jgi:hypothetical protein
MIPARAALELVGGEVPVVCDGKGHEDEAQTAMASLKL